MKATLPLLLLTGIAFAADTPTTTKPAAPKSPAAPVAPKAPPPAPKVYPKNPTPTQANVRYGPHERNVLDFWKAKSDKPTPLLFFIHGGGWTGGDKAGIAVVQRFLKAGISVVSINYRYIHAGRRTASAAGERPARTMPRARCSSCAARRPSGTSTRRASAPPAARPARAPASGSPSIPTWPIRRAATPSPASPPASGAPP